jgi:hypothetical protein
LLEIAISPLRMIRCHNYTSHVHRNFCGYYAYVIVTGTLQPSPAVYHLRRPPLFSRRLPFIIPCARSFSAVVRRLSFPCACRFSADACRLSSPAPVARRLSSQAPAAFQPSPAVYHPLRPPLFSRRPPFIIPGALRFSTVARRLSYPAPAAVQPSPAVYHPRRPK